MAHLLQGAAWAQAQEPVAEQSVLTQAVLVKALLVALAPAQILIQAWAVKEGYTRTGSESQKQKDLP